MPRKVYREGAKGRKIKLMKIVAVFLSDETTTRRLALAFRNRCLVRRFDGFESAKKKLHIDNIMALVVDMRGRGERGVPTVVDLIAQLHGTWPSFPVIGYVNFSPQRMRDVLAAAHAGATELILDDYDDLDRVANKIADIGTSSDATTQIEVAIRDFVPDHLWEFFHFCIANARQAVDVDGAVIRMRRSRKTLSNWLQLAQLPPPARIIGWTRVLVAARMLEDTTRSTEKVARELHFMSGTSLRNMVRRYLHCGPEQLREHGGFQYALRMFVEELASRSHVRQ
ncbi:MAG TPA: helix-turn-helix domain-containing protein [Gemmatimonadaceae bacterium]|jgi:hypothetical protein|nr:helix-turn-helix domain-containing protein [Gemmatimonadaceae bacterium]